MFSRREFAFFLSSTLASLAMSPSVVASRELSSWYMPDEGEPHTRTWMAFGAHRNIWGRSLLPQVQEDLATIANTIAQYEPVTMLVRPGERELARELLCDDVTLVDAQLDDLWIRDTGPVFVRGTAGMRRAVDLNFNGWGNKQRHSNDAQIARRVAQLAGVPALPTSLVLEGGCIEVDGHGTGIMTRSCTLNDNRNPGVSRAEFEDVIMPLLGLEKIIWLPGIAGRDITDGHTDFYVRFVRPGTVLAGVDPDPSSYDHEVTLEHLEILASATDASGEPLEVVELVAPVDIREDFLTGDFAAGYIGYYLCNGAVVMQSFGDARADAEAKAVLEWAYPTRRVEQIAIDAIAAGGGSIHCATQQEPA